MPPDQAEKIEQEPYDPARRELSLLGDRVASACDHAQRHRGVTADDAVAVLISVASDIIDERPVDDRGRRLRLALERLREVINLPREYPNKPANGQAARP